LQGAAKQNSKDRLINEIKRLAAAYAVPSLTIKFALRKMQRKPWR
jgi:hypothetical protein